MPEILQENQGNESYSCSLKSRVMGYICSNTRLKFRAPINQLSNRLSSIMLLIR